MPFVPAVNVARVELVFDANGQTVENVFHVHKSDGWTTVELIDLTSVFIDWWNDELKPTVSHQLALGKVRARDLTLDGGIGVEVPVTPVLVGDVMLAMSPNNVTLAVKWNTGYTGRSYRGRTYHLGLTSPQYVGNTVTDGVINALTNAYGTLIAGIPSYFPTGALGVLSTWHGGVPRTLGVFTPIITCSIDNTLDSQRRRLPGRGR